MIDEFCLKNNYLISMKYTVSRLNELKKELIKITKDVEQGTITPKEAADKIIIVREEMEEVVRHLKELNDNNEINLRQS
jgi:hypothetical protein